MRNLKTLVAGGLLAVTALFSAACSDADTGSGGFQAGRDYTEVPSPPTPADPKRITVEEFFWYGCPHCFSLDPAVEQWRASKPAEHVRAQKGIYLHTPTGPCLLVRVLVPSTAEVYPEISAGRHRFTVRFMTVRDVAARAVQAQTDIPFQLQCCHL